MLILGRLLEIVFTESKLSRSILFRKILLSVAGLFVLSIILGILVSVLIVYVLFVIYHVLLLNGLENYTAQATVSIITLLLMGLIYYALQVRTERLKRDIIRLLSQQSPISSRLNDVADSFMHGLMESSTAPKG